jgi:hypothetical protein
MLFLTTSIGNMVLRSTQEYNSDLDSGFTGRMSDVYEL